MWSPPKAPEFRRQSSISGLRAGEVHRYSPSLLTVDKPSFGGAGQHQNFPILSEHDGFDDSRLHRPAPNARTDYGHRGQGCREPLHIPLTNYPGVPTMHHVGYCNPPIKPHFVDPLEDLQTVQSELKTLQTGIQYTCHSGPNCGAQSGGRGLRIAPLPKWNTEARALWTFDAESQQRYEDFKLMDTCKAMGGQSIRFERVAGMYGARAGCYPLYGDGNDPMAMSASFDGGSSASGPSSPSGPSGYGGSSSRGYGGSSGHSGYRGGGGLYQALDAETQAADGADAGVVLYAADVEAAEAEGGAGGLAASDEGAEADAEGALAAAGAGADDVPIVMAAHEQLTLL